LLLRISCSLILCAVFAADARIPGKAWEKRRGSNWSDAKLKAAREYAGTLKTSAVLIVQDGAIVDEWGDVTKKYLCHSIRKSFLSALYGIAAAGGKIDISKTLEDLGIDDNEPSLTAEEKRASVGDLLKARSGVYHPALAETASMKAVRPLRGSHSPGTFWYYNNWDFNALGAIYEKLTQEKIHESFERRIAQPIGMESYSTSDGSYSRGPDSIHPAYPFKMSTRDLARFGVLFLNQGRWGGREIVPARWVADSIKAWSDASAYGAGGYGYMWWVDKNSYSARGAGGHYLVVVPEMNLVVVHRVDTFVPDNSVGAREFYKLLDLIVEAGGRKDLTPAAEATTAPPCRQPDSTCGERLYLGDKHIVFYRSHSPQTGRHPGVRRAFVLVHGASRNGDAYFGVALASAAAAGRLDDTVLIAPHFRANAAGCRDKTEPAEYGLDLRRLENRQRRGKFLRGPSGALFRFCRCDNRPAEQPRPIPGPCRNRHCRPLRRRAVCAALRRNHADEFPAAGSLLCGEPLVLYVSERPSAQPPRLLRSGRQLQRELSTILGRRKLHYIQPLQTRPGVVNRVRRSAGRRRHRLPIPHPRCDVSGRSA